MASSSYDTLDQAVADLDALQQISGPDMRNKALDQLNAAVLIDIAASLRIIAEAHAGDPDQQLADDDGQMPASIDDAPLEVGDRVAPREDEGDLADDLVDDLAGVIESIGVSEGEEYAVVLWDGGSTTRVWVSALRRVVDVDDLVGWDSGNPLGDGTTTAPAPEPAMPVADAFEALRKGKKAKKGKGDE